MRGIGLYSGLVLLLVVVTGCGRKITSSTITETHDSTYVKFVPRIDSILVPGETVFVHDIVECDSNTNKPKPKTIKAKSGKAKVSVEIKADGSLDASGGCDSLTQVVRAMDKEIYRLRHERTSTQEIVYVHDPYWFDIAARWIAGISILLTIAIVFVKINKPRFL